MKSREQRQNFACRFQHLEAKRGRIAAGFACQLETKNKSLPSAPSPTLPRSDSTHRLPVCFTHCCKVEGVVPCTSFKNVLLVLLPHWVVRVDGTLNLIYKRGISSSCQINQCRHKSKALLLISNVQFVHRYHLYFTKLSSDIFLFTLY